MHCELITTVRGPLDQYSYGFANDRITVHILSTLKDFSAGPSSVKILKGIIPSPKKEDISYNRNQENSLDCRLYL